MVKILQQLPFVQTQRCKEFSGEPTVGKLNILQFFILETSAIQMLWCGVVFSARLFFLLTNSKMINYLLVKRLLKCWKSGIHLDLLDSRAAKYYTY